MANVQGNGDLAVFTLDGSSQLALIKGVTYNLNLSKGDTTTIARAGHRRQTVKKSSTIKTGVMSALSGDATLVATNLAVSAFALGGVSYLAYLRGCTINGTTPEKREVGGLANAFKWPQAFGKDYSIDVTLVIPAAADSQTSNFAVNMGANLHDTDLTDQDLTRLAFTITIDNVTIAMTCEVDDYTHEINGQQEQVITLKLSGNDPGTGAYPTTPTGTTSILEKAFNAYNTAVAVVLTSGAAASGETYSGNFMIPSFSIGIQDESVIMIDLDFESKGTITAAAA